MANGLLIDLIFNVFMVEDILISYKGLYKDTPTEIIMYWSGELNSIDSASEVFTIVYYLLGLAPVFFFPNASFCLPKFGQSYRETSALSPSGPCVFNAAVPPPNPRAVYNLRLASYNSPS